MRALVRPVPSTYPSCLRSTDVEIEPLVAWAQHAAYVAALRLAGVEVILLPPKDEAPDSVFVEDTLVVLDKLAVVTRPGAPSRETEGNDLPAFLEDREILHMTAPATLDGGDVLRFGRHLFIGLSSRTNRAGFDFLAAVATRDGFEPVAVEVAGGLHLKSACSRLGDAVIGHFDRLDKTAFTSRGIRLIDAPDELGANVLELGTKVIVSAAAPKTAALGGSRTIIADVGEFHKGDGALTCLSVLIG